VVPQNAACAMVQVRAESASEDSACAERAAKRERTQTEEVISRQAAA